MAARKLKAESMSVPKNMSSTRPEILQTLSLRPILNLLAEHTCRVKIIRKKQFLNILMHVTDLTQESKNPRKNMIQIWWNLSLRKEE